MQNLKKEEDLVKNEQEKSNKHLLYITYKNIKVLNQLCFHQYDTIPMILNQKNSLKTHNLFNISQFLYANMLLPKNKVFFKKYFIFLLINANKIFLKKNNKKVLIKKKLKKIFYQKRKELKNKKKHFFSQRIIFFYFKNLHSIGGLKKQQPISNRLRREKYINRLLVLIHRKLSLSELSYEKQAKQKMRRIQDFSSRLGILHYVTTTKNLKLTFTNARNRVLFYMSSGNKNCKKVQRRKRPAKIALNDRMIKFVSQKGYKRVILVFHGHNVQTFFLKKLFRNIGIKIIKRIYKKNPPHNGCRKKRLF